MGFSRSRSRFSVAALFKWLFILGSAPFWYKAYQGIAEQKVSAAYDTLGTSTGRVLQRSEAMYFGIQNAMYALGCFFVAWLVWRFWQNEV